MLPPRGAWRGRIDDIPGFWDGTAPLAVHPTNTTEWRCGPRLRDHGLPLAQQDQFPRLAKIAGGEVVEIHA